MEEQRIDQVTETTNTSWFSRLGQAFAGVLIGLALVPGSGALLFWNEGRAIKTARGLDEGAGVVRSVAAERVDQANEGRLVHVTATLATAGPALDAEFGVRSAGVRLVRQVEMYQWIEESTTETRTKLGGGEERVTTYKYQRGWSEKPIDSAKFKEPRGHTNPAMVYRARDALAPGVKIGAFAMSESMLAHFGEARALAATTDQADALQRKLRRPVAVIDGVLTVGRDPAEPAVGDLRISFKEVPLQAATVVAAQAGGGFAPYRTKQGTTVSLVSAGTYSAAEMFADAQAANTTLTWILRAVGALLMFVGFSLILRPLSVLGDVIPLLGDIIRAGAGFVGLVCTLAIAPVVIAAGWLFYRPLVGIAVIVIGIAATWGVSRLARQKGAAPVPRPAGPIA